MSSYESPYGAEGRVSSIPGGSVYARAALMANNMYQKRLADLTKQRQQTMITAGYQGNIDPKTGLITGLQVDPNAKYGQLQMLNRSQGNQMYDVIGGNLERGLGAGGGLAAQQMSNARFGWGQQDADFARGFQDTLAGFDRSQQDYLYERDRSLYEAELQAAQFAQQSGDFTDVGYDDGGGGPGGGDPGGGGPSTMWGLPPGVTVPPLNIGGRARPPAGAAGFGGGLGGALIANQQNKKKKKPLLGASGGAIFKPM